MRARARLSVWRLPPLRIGARTSWRGYRPRIRMVDFRERKLRTSVPVKLGLGMGLLAFDWRGILRTAAVAAAVGTMAAAFVGFGWYPLVKDCLLGRLAGKRP